MEIQNIFIIMFWQISTDSHDWMNVLIGTVLGPIIGVLVVWLKKRLNLEKSTDKVENDKNNIK